MSRSLKFFLAGLVLCLVPYANVLADGQAAFLYRDLSNIMVPYKTTWLAAVRELGRIPHWDPLHGGGFRFLADLNYGPLYPLNVLLFPLSAAGGVARGLTLWIVLHHVLAFAGQFLFLRGALRVRAPLALAGALAVAWCGPSVSGDNILHHVCSQACVGFFLFAWYRALRRDCLGLNLFLASFALAWPVYGGDPQYSYVLGFYAAALAFARNTPREALRKLAALAFLTALAAGPQLFPTAHYLGTNGRMLDAITDADRIAWSLHPVRLGEMLFPLAFGTSPAQGIAGFPSLLDGPPVPFVFSSYAGASFAVLALWHAGLFFRRRRRWGWGFAFAALVLLCLGHYSPVPLFAWFLKFVPLWRNFRYPERLNYWVALAVILFGSLGAEKALRLGARRARRATLAAFALVALAAAGFGWLLPLYGGTLGPVLRTLVVAGAALLLIEVPVPRRVALLALLGAFDVGGVASQLVWTQPASLASPARYPWAEKILADRAREKENFARGEAERFFSFVPGAVPSEEKGLSASVYTTWGGMKYGTPSAWGIPLVRGHSSLTPDRPVLRLAEWDTLVPRALLLLGARYLLEKQGGQPVARVSRDALPQAQFPSAAESVPDPGALAARLRDLTWDPRASILVEAEPGDSSGSNGVELERITRAWDRLSLRVRARVDTPERWASVSEAFDAGWSARARDQALPLARANGWAIAVRLPALRAGESLDVELSYRDAAFEAGLLAFAAWGLLLGLVLRRRALSR